MPAKLDRCVRKVRAKGVKNPWAVCNAAGSGKRKKKAGRKKKR